MKKSFLYIVAATAITIAGCSKNFDAINIDPTQADSSTFNPNLLLPSAELSYTGAISGYSGPILFQSMWVQIFASASYPSYYSNGDKYVASGNTTTYQASLWNNAYRGASLAREIQNLTNSKMADYTNLRAAAVVMEIACIQVVTDAYGDCPYSQALQAKSGLSQPMYDKQQDIYPAILSRLDSVLNTFDATKAPISNDAFSFHGDITKWKKFGYSLMLRLAMRLVNVAPSVAQQYAEKAATGGTFSSVDDNAYLRYDNANGYNNPNSAALTTPSDYVEVRWGQKLIDMLKESNDPRLPVIAEVPPHGAYYAAGADKPVDSSTVASFAGNSTPALQLGMPNGYDQNGGATDISKSANYPGPSTNGGNIANGKYSRPKTSLYLSLSAPVFVLTYPETEFLLAEAAVRGWNVGGDAATHYANGVAGSLLSYGQFNNTTPISTGDAAAYAAAHPLVGNSLQQINEQYWITTGTLFNFLEAWNNWKRSGYPELTPVNYAGNFSNGQIPARQPYPLSEATTNGANYNTAVSGLQGGDSWTGHVWWDQQ